MKINWILKQGQRQSWMHPLFKYCSKQMCTHVYIQTHKHIHPNTYVDTHIKVEGRLCQEDVGEKAGTRSEYGQNIWYNWIQRSSGYLITLYDEYTLIGYFLIRKASLIFNFKMPGNYNVSMHLSILYSKKCIHMYRIIHIYTEMAQVH